MCVSSSPTSPVRCTGNDSRRHAPGPAVDEEHQIGAGPGAGVGRVSPDADVHEPGGGVPRRGHQRDVGGERRLAVLGGLVVVGEVVDQLLHPHRVVRRPLPPIQRRAHEAVGRGVDVDREGRHRLFGDHLDRMGVEIGEAVAAVVAVVAARPRVARRLREATGGEGRERLRGGRCRGGEMEDGGSFTRAGRALASPALGTHDLGFSPVAAPNKPARPPPPPPSSSS